MHIRPRVSAVVISHNACQALFECLRSLTSAEGAEHDEIIVVDNASSDGSCQMVRNEFPSVIFIRNEINTGFGGACNQGVAVAEGAYTFILNSDCRVHPRAATRLVAALEADRRLALVGPRLFNADGTPQRSEFGFLTPANLMLEQFGLARFMPTPSGGGRRALNGYLKGAALFGRTELLRTFGPFDTDYFMYCEDVDLCYRLTRAGLRLQVVPEAVVTHIGEQSSRLEYERMAVQAVASTYLFYRKHYDSMTLRLAVAVFKVASALKWVRDAGRLLPATLRRKGEEQLFLRRQMRVWRRIGVLQPAFTLASVRIDA